jgi:molybdopterin-binding protein
LDRLFHNPIRAYFITKGSKDNSASSHTGCIELSSKLSARNQLKGKVTSVKKGSIVGLVEIEITGPGKITSVITADSIDELSLKAGDEVNAVIKATEVMVSKR